MELSKFRLEFDDPSLKEQASATISERQELEIASLRALRQDQIRVAAAELRLQEREREMSLREKCAVEKQKSLEEEQARFDTERERYVKLRDREQCLGDTLMALEEDRRKFLLNNIFESDKKLGNLESELHGKHEVLETALVGLRKRCEQLEAGMVKIARVNIESKKKMSQQEKRLSGYENSLTILSKRASSSERYLRLCLGCCFVLLMLSAPARGLMNHIFKRFTVDDLVHNVHITWHRSVDNLSRVLSVF